MHGTNLYALPTRCRHILPIFFLYFILRGIFFQNRGKKHTFWLGENSRKKHCKVISLTGETAGLVYSLFQLIIGDDILLSWTGPCDICPLAAMFFVLKKMWTKFGRGSPRYHRMICANLISKIWPIVLDNKTFKVYPFGCHGNQNSKWNWNLWTTLKEGHVRTISVKLGEIPSRGFGDVV